MINDVKIFFEHTFVPMMKEVFKETNPEKYEEYQGNCCRQTAVLGCHILTGMLPNFEWTAWQGEFEDKLYGKDVTYVHAWIYGKCLQENLRFIIDMSRTHKQNIWVETPGNRYPKEHPDYKDMKELWREKLDWKALFKNIEYYTGKKSRDVIGIIFKRILKNEERKRALMLFSTLLRME